MSSSLGSLGLTPAAPASLGASRGARTPALELELHEFIVLEPSDPRRVHVAVNLRRLYLLISRHRVRVFLIQVAGPASPHGPHPLLPACGPVPDLPGDFLAWRSVVEFAHDQPLSG